MSKITPTANGPYKVEDGHLVDEDGNAMESKPVMFLCRCGHSENKPFCDASHKKVDFKSE